MKLKIAPSILSADFGRLDAEIASVEKYIDMVHVDVMDGHFVPNLTLGAPLVRCLKTKLPLDCHLMIEKPERYIKDFALAGAASITVHYEACGAKTARIVKAIKKLGVRACVAINPKTPLSRIEKVLPYLDMVLVMSVQPGFGGQSFIPSVLSKIRKIRARFPKLDIQIDGGINDVTVHGAVSAGANVIVAGSYIFQAKNRKHAIDKLRKAA